MEHTRDTGIVALVLFASACLTVFFLRAAPPTGALVDFLLSRI
jgi:hypothetical protein